MKKINDIERERCIEKRLFFAVALFFISVSVINRIYGSDTGSDMADHLSFSKQLFTPENVISYPLFHLLVIVFEKMFTLKWAGIFVQSGCYVVTYFVVVRFMNRLIPRVSSGVDVKVDAAEIPLIAFLIAFLSPIYLPWIMPNIYLGQGGLQIWHNPTVTLAIPFALLLVYQFLNLFERNNQYIPVKKFVLFAVLFFVSNLAKPSFYIAFAPAVSLFLLIDLIAHKFETVIFCIKIGISFIPATALFLYQTFFFHSNTKFSFSISPFTAWNIFSPNILLSIVVGLAFPMAVILLLWKRVKENKPLILCMLLILISIIEFAVFSDGTSHGNFGWGYYICQYILFVYCFSLYGNHKKDLPFWKNNIIFVIFLLHLASGICYLYQVLIEGRYVILINGAYY